jgi:tRNA(Leu) C34 or U34 (ribose-2'-O)-methylase TrmL
LNIPYPLSCSAIFWLTNSLLHAAKVDYVLKFMQIAEHNERMNGPNVGGNKQQRMAAMEEGDCLLLGGECRGVPFRVPSSHALDKFVEHFLKSDGVSSCYF